MSMRRDSSCETLVSQCENVFCSVDVPVVDRAASIASPLSHSKACATFRTACRYASAARLALPMEWISNSEPLLLKAADYKAHFPLSMADAWIAACASENSAVLLHKDPSLPPCLLRKNCCLSKINKPNKQVTVQGLACMSRAASRS